MVMIPMSSPDALPKTLCEFINLVLASGVSQEVRRVFFGASHHAISKKDGGLNLSSKMRLILFVEIPFFSSFQSIF